MTVHDEEFTEDDMQAALEWNHERSHICSGCGLPLEETTAVGREGAYSAEMVACHACAAAERAERVYREGNGDMAGVRRRVFEVD